MIDIISPFLILLLLTSVKVDAQLQELLQNPNITWIAETNFEYILEDGDSFYIDYKMDVTLDELPFPNNQLDAWIRHVISLDSIHVKSATTGKKLSKDAIENIMLGIELDTLNDKVTIPIWSCGWVSFYSVYVKQYWFYNKNEDKLYTKVIELTPVEYVNDTDIRKLFTIELNEINSIKSLEDFSNSEIKWVVKNEMKLDFNEAFQCIKGTNESFFEDYLMNAEYHCGKYDRIYANTRCNSMTINQEDGLSFMKPSTQDKEQAQRVILYEDIKGIQLQQMFYINSSTNEFGAYLYEISPVVKEIFKNDYPPIYEKVWMIKCN
jgi:hypothetical protein